MSQVYSTEPQTAGRVVLETTHGPLEINLWSRECPATTKYFLQLCLDGYYDNVLFHRIVPNFLIQTGGLRYNPTPFKGSKASSSSSAAITSLDDKIKELQTYRQGAEAPEALDRRSYELNTRIRFNHRGQVAMALPVESEGMGDDELALQQPQFFITLDEASELDGKHVCFGTVTGPTVFNALRIGNADVDDETNQPTILEEAPRIERVKILDNPIHTSIVPTTGILPWQSSSIGDNAEDTLKKKRKKRKGVKNLNVLSFGDEMAENEALGAGSGIKSSHDVIETKRFSKEVDKKLKQVISRKDKGDNDNEQENSMSKDTNQVEHKKQISDDDKKMVPPRMTTEESQPALENAESAFPGITIAYKSSSDRRQEETKMQEKLEVRVEEPHAVKEKPPKVGLVEARRAKYAKRGQNNNKRKREEDTMAKFKAFQSKVTTKRGEEPGASSGKVEDDDGIAARLAKRVERDENDELNEGNDPMKDVATYHGQFLENDDEAISDWMKTRFKCRKHQDLDAKLGGDGRDAMEDYEVVEEKYGGRRNKDQGHRKHHHKIKTRDKYKLV